MLYFLLIGHSHTMSIPTTTVIPWSTYLPTTTAVLQLFYSVRTALKSKIDDRATCQHRMFPFTCSVTILV